MKVIVHNLSKMKEKKEIKINNKLQNLINDIIDFDLRIKDKELRSKEDQQRSENERLNKKDENIILTTNDLRNKEKELKLKSQVSGCSRHKLVEVARLSEGPTQQNL